MSIETFFGVFNIILGALLLLTGLKIIIPARTEKWETSFKKNRRLYTYGGIILIVGGALKIIFRF